MQLWDPGMHTWTILDRIIEINQGMILWFYPTAMQKHVKSNKYNNGMVK